MEGFMQHGDSETARIIPFAYQRLPSTKQPFWISLNIIFQTIYPLGHKLDRQQAEWLHRKAEFIQLNEVTRQVDNLQIQRQHLQSLSLKQFSCYLST